MTGGTQTPQPNTSSEVEDELRVALRARQELGEDHEDEVIESFLFRVQDAIDARVEAKVNEALRDLPARSRFTRPSAMHFGLTVCFIAVVLTFTLPLADIAGSLVALAVAIACIVFAAAMLTLPESRARAERHPKRGEDS